MSDGYRIVPGVFARPSRDALAPVRAELADALADMGTGIVIDPSGRVVAFHESHLRFVTAGVGDYRVSKDTRGAELSAPTATLAGSERPRQTGEQQL